MKRFGVCFKLEIVKNMVKAKGAGRFGCLANMGCRDANGKVQTSCSVAVLVSNLYLFCMRSHVSVSVCDNYLFVFGLAGRLFVSIRIANWGGKTLFVSTRLAGL